MNRRVISVLLAVLCVIGSGAVLRFAEDHPWREYDHVNADVGEWVSIGQGGYIRITSVSLGRDMTKRGEVVGMSSGRFVQVEGEIRAEEQKLSGFNYELHSDGRTYQPIDENGMITPPGHISNYGAIFEVPEDALNDLTVTMYDVEYISGYTRRLRHTAKLSEQDLASSRLQKVELGSSELQVIE